MNVSEPKPPADTDSPLSFTMEGYKGTPPAPLTPFFWAPGWNSGQSVNKYQMEVGGPLYGGNPGTRLFDKRDNDRPEYFNNIPAPFKPAVDEWEIIPLPHIFGSEELSVVTGGIAELSPAAYVAINRQDAESLSVGEGSMLQVILGKVQYELPVKVKQELPMGTAGIPYNLRELYGIGWPARGKLIKQEL
jgi:NADH-quinone oxidoreductase subunit G